MPLTVKQLQSADWKEVYHYPDDGRGVWFKTFCCGRKGITVTHNKRLGVRQVQIYYTVHGRKTDSPSQAVKWWNETEKKALANGS